MKSEVDKLIDEIQVILKGRELSFIDFAREFDAKIKAGDSKYNQLYNWIFVRSYRPKGETVMRLMQWRDKHRKWLNHGKRKT